MYRVFRTEAAHRRIGDLPTTERLRVTRVERRLAKEPHVGKPLRYRFFREKRINGVRLYYLVYDDLRCVLVIAISDKKEQPEVIDAAAENLAMYRITTQELLRRHGGYGRA